MKIKFLIILFFITIFLFGVSEMNAASTPTPTQSDIKQQLDELKNNIASKVAQLNLVEKRGIIGTVTDSSDTQITLSDLNGNTRIVDVDEITKFSSSSSKTFGISDIKKGTFLGILGLYNKESRRILARQVNEMSAKPKIIFGGISLIDNKNFELTVVKESGQKIVIEVTDLTKSSSFTSDSLEKFGFSKMKETNTILAIGFPDKNDSNKLLATRIIILPDIDITSRINLSLPEATITPSTGSGIKLFPIKK
ncbi:MAG TPA: hypothetical protein VES68_01985 [Candidatus Sulfotelmatobacter sp.]|nr:hypothetical protein [Candidatus Sulfotelmatobacter sp.]